jgi:hypothetical protein
VKSYLITKSAEPEAFGDAYASSLARLPGSEELLMATGEKLIKIREMPAEDEERQLAELRSDTRWHILEVSPDYTAKAPEPEVVAEAAEQLDPEEIRDLVGFARAYEAGGTGKGRRIAILDTGVSEQTMRELGPRIAGTKSRIQGEPSAVNPEDSHGDWCLQIIAYLLPDAEFYVGKVLSYRDGSGSYSGCIAGLQDARDAQCTAANMSLGGPRSQIMNDAVDATDRAGVLVGAAAGNEQRGRAETDYVADRTSPASAARALTFAASDSERAPMDFSNRGTCVDASAPGRYTRAPNVDGYWSGTSMAAPIGVAGCEAIASTGKTKDEVRQLVLGKAHDTPALVTAEGQGFVDLAAVFAAPEAPAPFHPELPRVAKTRVDNVSFEGFGNFVMTYKGEDVYYCERKR